MSAVPPSAENRGASSTPVVIDMGKRRRKDINKLRKGKPGDLLSEVQEAIETLREQGGIAPSAQAVIVVVKERRPKARWPGF